MKPGDVVDIRKNQNRWKWLLMHLQVSITANTHGLMEKLYKRACNCCMCRKKADIPESIKEQLIVRPQYSKQ